MSETLVCAWCGEPLGQDYVTRLDLADVPGCPSLAWHTGGTKACANVDPCRAALMIAQRGTVPHALHVVASRGWERVAALRWFWELHDEWEREERT